MSLTPYGTHKPGLLFPPLIRECIESPRLDKLIFETDLDVTEGLGSAYYWHRKQEVTLKVDYESHFILFV